MAIRLAPLRGVSNTKQTKNQQSNHSFIKTSLPRRLQVLTLPEATPPTGKIHPSCKSTVIFEPMMQFKFPLRFRISQ